MNAWIEFTEPEQVKVGTAVVLRPESERMHFCPFATLLISEIKQGATHEETVYTLRRPYLSPIEGATGAVSARDETLKITGFRRLSQSVVAHNTGRGQFYVMSWE